MLMLQINMSISLLVFFLALTTIHAQNVCSSNSICINIRNCPDILSILTSTTPISAEVMRILRNLQCGFEYNDPKYCCNQVITTTTTTTTTTVKPEIGTPDPPDVTNHPNLRLLNHQACGPIPQQRVSGGNKTEIFQYPWMVLIAYSNGSSNPEFHCGGTIISSRYVLTAAHCVADDYEIGRVIGVRIGDHDISKERDCIKDNKGLEIVCAEKYQDFGVDSVYPHPGYTDRRLQNDIALIRLNGSIDFTPRNVKPICLPFGTATTLNHKKAIVTGWGSTVEYAPRSQELLQAKLPLKHNEYCEEHPGYYKEFTNMWYKQLCTGHQTDAEYCSADGGGPLQTPGIYNGSVRIIQHGVISFGIFFCHNSKPGVYTRVSYYMDWILNTMTD